MIVFGVTFLVVVVLLGTYGLRVRAARLKQAENAIAELEDALRETGAAVGRVESGIALVTNAVKGALTRPAPPKLAPKGEPSISPHHVLLEEWKAGSKLAPPPRLPTKTAKGRKYSMVHAGEAPYYDAEWSGLTCPAPSR